MFWYSLLCRREQNRKLKCGTAELYRYKHSSSCTNLTLAAAYSTKTWTLYVFYMFAVLVFKLNMAY